MIASSFRARLFAVIAITTLGLVIGCHDSTGTGGGPAFLVVAPDSVPLLRFDSVALAVSVLDKDSALVSGVSITFQSTDTTIAKVSNLGVVHSSGPIGHATVVVTAAGLHRNIPVVVTGTPFQIAVSPSDTGVRAGQSYQLRTAVLDFYGDSLPNQPRVFESFDTAIAIVSSTGLVNAKKAGHATLRVSSGALASLATVAVLDTNIIARIPLGDAPYGVAASSAGVVYIAPIVGPAVRRLDMTTFALTDAITVGGDPAQVAFAGAGTALVTKRAAGSVGIIDVASHTQIDTIAIPGSPYPIRVSNDGATAYVASPGSWLYKLDVASRTRVDSVPAPPLSFHLALGPGDSLLYLSSKYDGTVTEVRTSTMTVVRTFTTGGTPQGIVVSEDGAELYVADETGPLRIWSLSSATEIDTASTGGGTFGVALTPDGTKLFVGTTAGVIFLINRVTRAVIHRLDVGGTPRNIAVDPVTGYAVVPNEAGGWIDIVK